MKKLFLASTTAKWALSLLLVSTLGGCKELIDLLKEEKDQNRVAVRFATYNASLNRFNQGDLINDLSTPDNEQARKAAEVIQRNRPDVLALLEFDYDPEGRALDLFQQNYLSVSQNGAEPIEYPYAYAVPSNTGVLPDIQVDFNNNGSFNIRPDDAFGFGFFPGQFAFVVLSKYEIKTSEIRTFQNFLWKDMPAARLPMNPDGTPYYSPEELDVFRLSSKNHVDVPIKLPNGKVVHALVAHPTPPVFDGPEDRNGTRNFDEIRLFNDYINNADYLVDDSGVRGGLGSYTYFVIMGDMNADPNDGDATGDPISTLFFSNPRINPAATIGALIPSSQGAAEAAAQQGGANAAHVGNPAFDTSDFNDQSPGNLRVDYVLPSANIKIQASGVFWPISSNPLSRLNNTSDHFLVWMDLKI
ncbi:MAG: endonuclease/exonuclease/phosphatase family protein [Bacteroidia bacterium]|nr:endonuclease/exonuclease/phosphatase family protein [Bacteroidia bacterium]